MLQRVPNTPFGCLILSYNQTLSTSTMRICNHTPSTARFVASRRVKAPISERLNGKIPLLVMIRLKERDKVHFKFCAAAKRSKDLNGCISVLNGTTTHDNSVVGECTNVGAGLRAGPYNGHLGNEPLGDHDTRRHLVP